MDDDDVTGIYIGSHGTRFEIMRDGDSWKSEHFMTRHGLPEQTLYYDDLDELRQRLRHTVQVQGYAKLRPGQDIPESTVSLPVLIIGFAALMTIIFLIVSASS